MHDGEGFRLWKSIEFPNETKSIWRAIEDDVLVSLAELVDDPRNAGRDPEDLKKLSA